MESDVERASRTSLVSVRSTEIRSEPQLNEQGDRHPGVGRMTGYLTSAGYTRQSPSDRSTGDHAVEPRSRFRSRQPSSGTMTSRDTRFINLLSSQVPLCNQVSTISLRLMRHTVL